MANKITTNPMDTSYPHLSDLHAGECFRYAASKQEDAVYMFIARHAKTNPYLRGDTFDILYLRTGVIYADADDVEVARVSHVVIDAEDC